MSIKTIVFKGSVFLLCLGMSSIFVYLIALRPWFLTRGATGEEANENLPGDHIITNPKLQYTQAITINAPKEIIWPYLKQVGYQRAGWYNHDWINRFLNKDYFYEGGRSAIRVIPELQDLKERDKIAIAPNGELTVEALEENELLLLAVRSGDEGSKDYFYVSWVFLLKEINKDTTRLIVRWQSDYPDGVLLHIANSFFVEVGGAGLQQPAMLKGLKERTEKDYAGQLKISN